MLRLQWLLQRQARERLGRRAAGTSAGRLRKAILQAYDLERGIKFGEIPSGRDGTALECLVVSLGEGGARSSGTN